MPLPIIQVGSSTDELIKALEKRPGQFARAVLPAATEAAFMLSEAIKESQFKGDPLTPRTGILRRSVASKTLKVGNAIISAIGVLQGPARSYARLLEEGGTIKAKSGKALAIPVAEGLTPGGRPRYPGGPREAERKHPGEIAFVKPKNGPPLIVRKKRVRGSRKGRVAKFDLLFVLLKSVTVPKKLWLSEGVLRNLKVFEVTFGNRMARELAA